MKRIVYLLVILFSIFLSNAASEKQNHSNINMANKFYLNGEYSKAAQLYEELIKSGYKSFGLYFNLGNSYYKMNKISLAIVNYERAKRINPGDDDLLFNLKVANLKTVDKIDAVPKFFLTQWFEDVRDNASSNTWSTYTIIFIWLGLAALVGFFLFWTPLAKKIFFALTVISFIVTIFSFIFAHQAYNYELKRDEAIISVPNVYIMSSPEETGTKLFMLHEGTKVLILDKVGDWKKIKIANGNVGWLQYNNIEII